MSSADKALETQLKNIQSRTGKTLDQLLGVLRASGLTKHGELRDMLKRDLGMGHGDANTVVHLFLNPADTVASPGDAVDEIYSGAKAALRPIHDSIMSAVHALGPFEIAPKKGYLSLRRKKQFAMVGPATKTRVEVGLNVKDLEATPRLVAVRPGGMCQFKVNVTEVAEVDAELIGWIQRAYDSAG